MIAGEEEERQERKSPRHTRKRKKNTASKEKRLSFVFLEKGQCGGSTAETERSGGQLPAARIGERKEETGKAAFYIGWGSSGRKKRIGLSRKKPGGEDDLPFSCVGGKIASTSAWFAGRRKKGDNRFND